MGTRARAYVMGRRYAPGARTRDVSIVPDDFIQWAAVEGTLKLRKRYNVGTARIETWRKSTGVYFITQRVEPKLKADVIRTRAKFRHHGPSIDEAIEELEDFDTDDLRMCVGYRGGYGEEW